jgi:hypothetical protein
MKKLVMFCLGLLLTTSTIAQAPEKISYQAVIRNGSNILVSSTTVGMQVSILQGSISGPAVYVETQMPISNANGLVSIEIGNGTIVSGDFTTLDWSNGPYFIKTETDPSGGTNYTIVGTSQLLSVPYALHAKSAESITGTITESDPIFGASVASGITGADTAFWNNKQDQLIAGNNISITGNTISAAGVGSTNEFYLGQDTLGGIVFYIYLDQNGFQRGLIVNKNESMAQWQSSATVTNATRSWDGAYNTSLMTSSPSANYVNGLTDGGFTDWYLPSVDEINILWDNRYHVNKSLNDGNFTLFSSDYGYWASKEHNLTQAYRFFAGSIGGGYPNKATSFYVRGIRAF